MAWTVETHGAAVDDEILALPPRLRAKLAWILDQIEARGLPALGPPHVKHLDGRIHEFRAKAQEGIGRALFVIAAGQRVVIVHVFHKRTRKTPPRVIRLAAERARSVT